MYMHFSRGDIYSPSMSAESGPGLQRKSCTGDPHPACRGGLSNAQQTATGRLGSVAQCGLSAYQQMISLARTMAQGPELRQVTSSNKTAGAACDSATEDELGKRRPFWLILTYLRGSYVTRAHWLTSQQYLLLLTLISFHSSMLLS